MKLRDDGLLGGWRDKDFPATIKWGEAPRFVIERAAVAIWGIQYGIHVNVYRQRGDSIEIFIAKRSGNKQTFPNKLDNCVAGGQPFQLTLMENVLKVQKRQVLGTQLLRWQDQPVTYRICAKAKLDCVPV